MLLQLTCGRRATDPARVAAVTPIELIFQLLAGKPNARCVDDNDEIAGVLMRGKGRLVFTAQNAGDTRGQPSEHLALGIDDVPTPRGECLLAARHVGRCLHMNSPDIFREAENPSAEG